METQSNFIVKVVRELLNHNFSILLHNVEKLEGNYGGWCNIDDDDREFVVAMKHPMGFKILVHEYCHFLQWKNDRKLWDSTIEYYEILFDWIENKNLETNENDLQKSLECIIRLEHDCEKKVLRLMKNNPIEGWDNDQYTKAINAYLWSYHLNKELRDRPKNPIYSERVLPNMSNVFNENVAYYLDKNNLTPDIRDALLVEYQENSSQG